MAVTPADIAFVRTQVLEKLQASPEGARYTDAIGTNSDFAVKQEITDNILIIDEAICTDIMSVAGHPYANQFMALSAGLASGDLIPAHVGAYGDVQVGFLGIFKASIPAKSREEVLRMVERSDVYLTSLRFHYVENNVLYHTGDNAKIYLPSWTKTAACQTPQQYEDVLISGTIQLSEPADGDSPFFDKHKILYGAGRELIRSGAQFIPPQEQLLLKANV